MVLNEEQWIKELREKRIAYGISQGRLAVASGITREYFNKIESGKMKPSKELLETLHKELARFNPEAPLTMLFDYVKIRFPTLDIQHIIKDILKLNINYMLHEDYGHYSYTEHYSLGDIFIYTSADEEKGVLLELKGRGCRQFESYLLAQQRSWYDFLMDALVDGGVMKRIDLAINDHTGILDIPELAEKCRKREYIGKPQFIYSWKLVPTDKTPAGKRDDISLREKETQIKKDLNDGIDTAGGKMTVCQLYDKKNSQRKNIKRATEKGRQYLMNALKNDPLGMRAIDTVKQSDAKEWAIRMSEKGYAYKTIDNYKRSLKASFYMAIQDDCIRKNPFEFKLSDVLEDDTEQKVILTPEQEERLLAFMEKDKIYSKYYDEVVLLLETGLRISEFCGLTTHIDMQNRILNIDHQLLKDSEIGYYIETPKTKNGKRELPLTERAYQAIQRILKNRGKAQPLIVGGYSNFLFLNREGLPKVAGNYEGMVRGLIKKYNKYHTDKLPNITPHSFRHTYCTNMANKGMNPNTLQYLMGHANITMTLGYYAHGTFQSAKAELERLAC